MERDLLMLSPRLRLMLSMDMDTMPTPTTMATMPTTPTPPTDPTAMAMLPQPTTMVPSMEDTDTERGLLRLSQRLRPMLRLSMDPTDTMPSDHTAMAMLPLPTLAMLPQPTLAMLATDLPTPMAPSWRIQIRKEIC